MTGMYFKSISKLFFLLDKLEYITKFSAESGLPVLLFKFSKAFTSGLKGVLKNFVMYSNLLLITYRIYNFEKTSNKYKLFPKA
jgi:hypothetical protein